MTWLALCKQNEGQVMFDDLYMGEWVYDEQGRLAGSTVSNAELAKLSDVFVVAHGWNNDSGRARKMFRLILDAMGDAASLTGTSLSSVGALGVMWPSMRWPDEDPDGAAKGAASVGNGPNL